MQAKDNRQSKPDQAKPSRLLARARESLAWLFFLIFLGLIVFWLLALSKSGKKNWEIEKSVMKPQLHEPLEVDVANSYFALTTALKGNIQDIRSGIRSFKTNFFRDFGIELRESKHVLTAPDRPDPITVSNEYAVLPSKRENGFRCFMLAYPKDDVFALVAVHVLLSYAQNKRLGSKGLTVLFVGYDPRYAKYQRSLQLFFERLNRGGTPANERTQFGLLVHARRSRHFERGPLQHVLRRRLPQNQEPSPRRLARAREKGQLAVQ